MKLARLQTEDIYLANHEAVYEHYENARPTMAYVKLANFLVRMSLRPNIYFSEGTKEEIQSLVNEGPVIMASNHLLFKDQFEIAAALHLCQGPMSRIPDSMFALAKAPYFEKSHTHWLMDKLGGFPVYRKTDIERETGEDRMRLFALANKDMINASSSRILGGENMLCFYEGKRNTSEWDTVGKVGAGIARIALKTNAPILPIGLVYDEKLKATVHFGSPIKPELENVTSLRTKLQAASQACVDSTRIAA